MLDDSIAFGHRRLAINDLSSAGLQPIASEEDDVVLIFNGEIYNSPELRRHCEAAGHRFRSDMDGEVIVHLWELEGWTCLARLNGIFAVAIADLRSSEVVIARDPLGVKPLFYSVSESDLWFASELSALRELEAPLGGPDPTALAQFLTFLWIPDPRTPFEGAQSLAPGHMLRWTPHGPSKPTRYCDPLLPSSDPARINFSTAVDDLGQQLKNATQRQLLADVPVGLMASGGIDSGLLWAASRDSLETALTIEWGARDDVEGLASDAQGVAELAARFDTDVQSIRDPDARMHALPLSGDLFADPAYNLTRAIASDARKAGVPVLLSGQGGDELFGGYRRHVAARLLPAARLGRVATAAAGAIARSKAGSMRGEYVARLLRAADAPSPFHGYMSLSSYSTTQERAEVLGCTTSEVTDEVVWQQHFKVFETMPPKVSFLRKVMAVDLNVYLPGLGLAYVDRAGMEHGIEIRVPWLDLDLVRWSLQLPDSCLISGRTGKRLPRALAIEQLGRDYATRPKRGFGAPSSQLPAATVGGKGFRQGRYMAMATNLLNSHLAASSQAR